MARACVCCSSLLIYPPQPPSMSTPAWLTRSIRRSSSGPNSGTSNSIRPCRNLVIGLHVELLRCNRRPPAVDVLIGRAAGSGSGADFRGPWVGTPGLRWVHLGRSPRVKKSPACGRTCTTKRSRCARHLAVAVRHPARATAPRLSSRRLSLTQPPPTTGLPNTSTTDEALGASTPSCE